MKLHVTAPVPALSRVVGAPWCTPALDALIARALEKRPRDRFGDAAEMLASIDAIARGLPPG